MTSSPINSLVFNVQENVTFTEQPESFKKQLNDLYNKSARAINARDISLYTINEILNGQKYINADSSQSYVYRIVINTGALLNAAPKAVNHNLNPDALGVPQPVPATWLFTRIYGFARNPATPVWIPLPNGGIHDCSLQVTATQVIITPTVDLSGFTESWVVLEYIKN